MKKPVPICQFCKHPVTSEVHKTDPFCRGVGEVVFFRQKVVQERLAAKALAKIDLRTGATVEGYFRSRMNIPPFRLPTTKPKKH